jgi:hypothetical protein
MNLIVERAYAVADDLAHARSRRAFLSALDHFERMLALAPDYPPGVLTESDVQQLGALADTVVTHVEDRLDRHTDRASVQRGLVDRIYAIRRDVEAVYTLTRTAGTPSPKTPDHSPVSAGR